MEYKLSLPALAAPLTPAHGPAVGGANPAGVRSASSYLIEYVSAHNQRWSLDGVGPIAIAALPKCVLAPTDRLPFDYNKAGERVWLAHMTTAVCC